jgi:phytoene synthase
MQVQMPTWEQALMSLAHEARHSIVRAPMHQAEPAQLTRAYRYCDELTAAHSKSFYLASWLLPQEKRRAVRALYAFCRVTDDIVDCGGTDREARLLAWRERALGSHPPADDLVALAWADARQRFQIPIRYAEQLIEGVAADLTPQRYETFDQLAAYSYGVASTVGLMSMHIVGHAHADAVRYAIKLGVALQLTNILRDVGEDWRCGRLYLPLEDLARFGLSPRDVARAEVTPAWRAFMEFQIARNRRLYAESEPGIRFLNRDGQMSILAASRLYAAILEQIEANDYDVFSRRAVVPAVGKLARLPGIWLAQRRGW